MTTEPYAVPTALTHLTRKLSCVTKGDGVVVRFPDGHQHHAIVVDFQGERVLVEAGGFRELVPLIWEEKP